MPTTRTRPAQSGVRPWEIDAENSVCTTGPDTPRAPAELLGIASAVLLQIKALGMQCTNVTGRTTAPPNAALVVNRAELREHLDFLETNPRDEGSIESVQACATTAMATGVGNCQEQASVAFVRLMPHATRLYPVQLISIDSGAVSHVLAVIGTWPRGGVVCDPWAEVCCPTEAYQSALQVRMSEWQSAKRSILVAGEGVMTPLKFLLRLSQGVPVVQAAHIL